MNRVREFWRIFVAPMPARPDFPPYVYRHLAFQGPKRVAELVNGLQDQPIYTFKRRWSGKPVVVPVCEITQWLVWRRAYVRSAKIQVAFLWSISGSVVVVSLFFRIAHHLR